MIPVSNHDATQPDAPENAGSLGPGRADSTSLAVGLMAKYWTPGEVKTRLAAEIGDVAACQLHYHCVQLMLRQLSDLTPHAWLALAPADRLVEVRPDLPLPWQATSQSDGDLGERISQVCQFLLGRSPLVGQIVVIGSDCPWITADHILSAGHALNNTDVVMGPAADGGYYLIGIRGPWAAKHGELFADIAWSTSLVAEQTRAVCQRQGLQLRELETLSDVDFVADLQRIGPEVGDARFQAALKTLNFHRQIPAVSRPVTTRPPESTSRSETAE
ncbi:TIGR04282 family arsenosugar biosynthesis glycosyltransferase [Planctomycetaceae bacterium SH139]